MNDVKITKDMFGGSDPLDLKNRDVCLEVVTAIADHNDAIDIWIVSGYKWEDVKDLPVFDYADVFEERPSTCRTIDVPASKWMGVPVKY